MSAENLREALVEEIRDLYNAEKQLLKALPKMAKGASSDELRNAFESHFEETEGHVSRLERVFELLEEKPRGKHCAGIAGIIEEGSDVLQEDMEDAVLDACLIASGQRAEHYEMAAYGTTVAWAEALELGDVAQLLRETLAEEKAADTKLSALAESGINQAATAGESEQDEQDEEDKPASRATAGRGSQPQGQPPAAAKTARARGGRR